MTGKADEAALCGCMAQMTPHPLGQTPCVFTAYQGSQPAPVSDDLETLRRELAETLRSWAAADTSDILGDDYDPADKRCLCHNAEGAADALLSGPLAEVLAEDETGAVMQRIAERYKRIAERYKAENERLAARLSGLRIDVATLRAERDALRLVADSWSALESKAAAERDEVKAERDALAAKIERLRDAANRAALALDHDDWCSLMEGCWPVQVFVPGDTPASSCTCRHAEALAWVRDALGGREVSADEAEGMCPNCVTPWKCNGPHLAPRHPGGGGTDVSSDQ